MPKASLLKMVTSSPGELALEMVRDILGNRRLGTHKKLTVLRELRLERISFDSPRQAVRIISGLAEVVSSDPHAEVRAAALEAMEHMIDLENKAEAEKGRPPVDWRKINVMLHKARKKAELDTVPVASRFGPPPPESIGFRPAKEAAAQVTEAAPPAPEMHPVAKEKDDVSPAEAALLTVQEDAVAAVRRGNIPPGPPPADMLAAEPEPPIMKFLRAVADTDDEDAIRALAKRIIARIEALTAVKPVPAQTLEPKDG